MENIDELWCFLKQCARRAKVIWKIIKHAAGKWANMSNNVIKLAKEFLRGKKKPSPTNLEITGDVVGDDNLIGNVPSIAAGNVPSTGRGISTIRIEDSVARDQEEKRQEDTLTKNEKGFCAEQEKQRDEGGGGEEEKGEGKEEEDKAALELFFAEKRRKRQQKKSHNGVQRSTRTKKGSKYGA